MKSPQLGCVAAFAFTLGGALLLGCAGENNATRLPAFPEAIGDSVPPASESIPIGSEAASSEEGGAAGPYVLVSDEQGAPESQGDEQGLWGSDTQNAQNARAGVPAGQGWQEGGGGQGGPSSQDGQGWQGAPAGQGGQGWQDGQGDGSGGPRVAPPAPAYADTDPSALTDFRAALDPYGTWTDDPTYGTVWVPSPEAVGEDFTPYATAGHWVYDDDYVWVSDYDWGWAPFHYGRWVWAGGAGWEWIPGREYAGAWVSWRYGWGDWTYVGWAPLGPAWCWRGGVAVGLGLAPAAPYVFVGSGELFAPSIGTRVIAGPEVRVIGAHTRPFIPASPRVGGRLAATPSVGGPPPAMLHIPASAIMHGAATYRGVALARAFARPSTVSVAAGVRGLQGAHGWRTPASARAPGPWSGSAPRASFGGPVGAGFRGSLGAGTPAPAYHSTPVSLGARPFYGAPQGSRWSSPMRAAPPLAARPWTRSEGPPPSQGLPRFHAAPVQGGAFRAAPRNFPTTGAPSGGSRPTGEYSGGGGGVVRSSGLRGGGWHGAGGFGGSHGGGRGGGSRR